jgi:methylglutaconyl-CoA hydratase
MSMTQAGHIQSTIKDKIAYITFYHPSHNSLPSSLLQQIVVAITAAGEAPSVSAIVLQSEGDKTFCAGASFDELSAIEDFDTGHRFLVALPMSSMPCVNVQSSSLYAHRDEP